LKRLQGLAVHEFHGDKLPPILLANIVDRADVRMIERRGGLGFAPKTFKGLLVLGQLFGEEFEGDGPMQSRVLGPVDDTHPSPAQLLDDEVMRDGLADHRAGEVETTG
jgi:hypothetical protein